MPRSHLPPDKERKAKDMEILTLPVGELMTNCYIVYEPDRQAVIIDPGAQAGRILEAVRKAEVTARHVLLTHVHFDHIEAAKEVLEATGADLLVPAGDAPALTNPVTSLVSLFRPGTRCDLQAARTLRDGDTVTAGALTLKVLHTPGHTPGSSCYLGDGILFSGDTLFAGSAGRTDFPGGDGTALLRSLKRLAALPGDYRVYPGHDESTTLEAERRHNPYMSAM